MNTTRQLDTLIAVVTGAGSGVGEAVAVGLAAAGVRVALVGRTRSKLERVGGAITEQGGRATIYPCDVTDPDQVEGLRDHVIELWGAPQVLVNSAGLHCELVPIAESTPADWIRTLQVNVVGPYLTCRAFLPGMTAQGWGRMINVTSAASLAPVRHIGSIYQLSKVSLNHFTRQLAEEVAGSGVTANVIHPGEVKTPMWAHIKQDAEQRTGEGREALGWAGMVEETGGDPPEKSAALVLELLQPQGDEINGQFLWIRDGIQKPKPSW